MVDALRRHVRLLREYRHRAFDEGNPDYYGAIAGKLRLLMAVLSGVTLDEFLAGGLGVVRPDRTILPLTNAELINVWPRSTVRPMKIGR